MQYQKLCKTALITVMALYAGGSFVHVYREEKSRIREENGTVWIEEMKASGFGEEELAEVGCFPVAADLERESQGKASFTFEDGFGEERTYGGERRHEGTDIMAADGLTGYYPVVSMTDGVIDKVGWLTLGGYRVGVRSPAGVYYYYAHLDSYSDVCVEGREVKAGELLGFVGDTGYGSEGTRGKFPAHLHLGIYLTDDTGTEYAVDPYPLLRFVQKQYFRFN